MGAHPRFAKVDRHFHALEERIKKGELDHSGLGGRVAVLEETPSPRPNPDPTALALVQATSGSTGSSSRARTASTRAVATRARRQALSST